MSLGGIITDLGCVIGAASLVRGVQSFTRGDEEEARLAKLASEEEFPELSEPAQEAQAQDVQGESQPQAGSQADEASAKAMVEFTKATRDEMIDALMQLGCQPEIATDDSIEVAYQGENFSMVFDGRYIRIWNPGWMVFKQGFKDVDIIASAMNAANFGFGPAVVMQKCDEDASMRVHARYDIMLPPDFRDKVPYVEAVLNAFFNTKESFRAHIGDFLNRQEAQAQRRPVGFDTSAQ